MTNHNEATPDAARTDKIEGIHKLPLFGALGVAVLALVVVAQAQVSGKGKVERSMGEVAESRSLIFRDAPGGKVVVRDAQTGAVLARYGRGEGAFIRQSMRAMSHKRNQWSVENGQPYSLVRTTANKLVINDPVTGQFITLNAFGKVATSGYAALLRAGTESANATSTSKKGT
ncbi:MAG: photosynthetic complex assembly protein PuhC [Pseudomonadota bacterium]